MFGFGKKDKIKIEQSSEGSHGDHWMAVYGFDESVDLETEVNLITDDLEFDTKLDRNTVKHKAKYGSALAIGIQSGHSLETLYPALFTSKTIPVNISSILEWSHTHGNEAQVLGGGRDTFGLNFFATDYPENKKKYAKGGELNIALAGFAYVIDGPAEMGEDFSDGFCAYLPNTDMPSGHDYNFGGEVLSVADIKFREESLLVVDVRLINDDSNPRMFVLPIVVNSKNIRVETLEIGGKVSGCFWLQGRIFGGSK